VFPLFQVRHPLLLTTFQSCQGNSRSLCVCHDTATCRAAAHHFTNRFREQVVLGRTCDYLLSFKVVTASGKASGKFTQFSESSWV
jgi:hypothetical protein